MMSAILKKWSLVGSTHIFKRDTPALSSVENTFKLSFPKISHETSQTYSTKIALKMLTFVRIMKNSSVHWESRAPS